MDGKIEPQASALKVGTPAATLPVTPIHRGPTAVRAWFDAAVLASETTLEAEREASEAFRRIANASNTRRAYQAVVCAWCAWCGKRDLPPLPGSGADVAAFLAAERRGGAAPITVGLRRAAIGYLHRVAGCPVPTDNAWVAEIVSGIRRQAATLGEMPRKKVAAAAPVLRLLLTVIPGDPASHFSLVGLRYRAVLLVGFAGALQSLELAAITAA